ncbi:signal peptidase II [Streptomyces axinellae]|uniref:Lipoprotein signal peptidase n=1 Tax=Streptomyces axinellae TaxID=552788 RepID=A0ABN3PRT1_9ACTN
MERPIGTPDDGADGKDGTSGAEGTGGERAGDGPQTEDEQAADEPATGEPAADGPGAGESAPGEPAAGAGRRRRISVLISVAGLAFVLDLVSKLIVVAQLEDHAPIDLMGSWLRLNVIRNPGAAFGLGEALTILLTAIAAAVVIVIARIARKLYSTPWAIALGLLLGGACGNLADRIFRTPGVFQGAVVDFIAPKHFAVFNLADSAIVCGGILIVLLSFRGLDPDGTVHRD